MLGKSISKNSFILGAFALATAGILASTFLATSDKIEASEKRAAEKALLEIIPKSRHDNDMLQDVWSIPEAGLKKLHLDSSSVIHLAKQNDQIIAAIIPSTAPDGYSGKIKFIVGINADGSIAGVRVLNHKETPGLGDKIDLNKSDWLLDFDSKSLNNPKTENWAVKKDGGYFDQFTGATITPRAVVNQLKTTLQYFEQEKHRILSIENNPSKAAKEEDHAKL